MTSPRFGLHADRYRRFRPGYPDAPFDRAAEACGAPHAYAVELGAGSGQATGQVLKRFARVLAVEPDADMAALIPPDPRLSVQVATAETADLGENVDAVFSATAFHWMDAAVVCRRVAQALRPRGVFLAIAYGPFRILAPGAAAEVLAGEAELWRPHMDPRLTQWRPYAELMAETGAFAAVETVDFAFEEARTPEAAAGLWLTTSFAAAYARSTGDEAGYGEAFARRLAEAAGAAPLTVGFTVMGALARV
jgi:SAM-dependent methyltransferase